MKKILNKSNCLNHVAYDIRGAIYDQARTMEKNGEKIIKLNIGNPAPFDFNVDPILIENTKNHIHLSQGYCESQGIESARIAIANHYTQLGATEVSPDDIFIANGASDLILMGLQALLNPNDEILIPAPDYPLWTAAATLAGGRVVHYLCDEESDWFPDIEDIKRKITDKTKAIVIINPNNPTGSVYSKEVLEQIAQIAREKNLLLFADEIYDQIVYDQAVHYPMSVIAPDIPVLTLNGLSKNYRATGFRQGWLIISGPKTSIRDYIEGLKVLVSMRLCGNVVTQYTIEAALKHDHSIKELISKDGRLYKQSRITSQMLNDIPGISCKPAQGSLYLFPKMDMKKFNIKDDGQVIMDFLTQYKVLLVKGTGFNWHKPDHFRIVTLAQEDILKEACHRMATFFGNYEQRR